jgi:hypothetical protein
MSTFATRACDCYGPQTFCGVQAPPPPFWEYAPPDHIILGVKLQEVDYGMDVLVLQSFSGSITADTVRVWGDCGLLCRVFVNTWADGDTLVLGLQDTDFSGNVLCGTALEQPGDYQISFCGQQWLSFVNGLVTGPILTEGAVENMTIPQFTAVLGGCLSTGIDDPADVGHLTLSGAPGSIALAWESAGEELELRVFDARGALIASRPWSGEPLRIPVATSGVYIARVRHGSRITHGRAVVP